MAASPHDSEELRCSREPAAQVLWQVIICKTAPAAAALEAALIDGKLLVACNASFDRRVLAAMVSRHAQS